MVIQKLGVVLIGFTIVACFSDNNPVNVSFAVDGMDIRGGIL